MRGRTAVMLVIVAVLLASSYFLLIHPSCTYGGGYDEESNSCSYSFTDCRGIRCVGPVRDIPCGETREVCREPVTCDCPSVLVESPYDLL